MLRIVFCAFLLTLLTVSISDAQQRPGGKGGAGKGGPPMSITGTVMDGTTGQGLEFATISIFSKEGDKVMGGGLSEENGSFTVQAKGRNLYAVIEFLSYGSQTIDPIEMEKGTRTVDLGTIVLEPSSVELADVEITAERSETTFSLDKKVFTVGKDLSNRGGSAEDVLDNVPSVAVDIEGTVSLRGSEGVRILIDGKPSGLIGNGTNGLRSIPSNLIKQVEVITNPSARYEAEGSAGIINIVLKKDQGHGFNGAIDVTGGVPTTGGVTANLNYRKGPLNWFVNLGVNYRTGPGGGYNIQDRLLNDGGSTFRQFTTLDRDIDRSGINTNVRFGADYFLSDKEQLTGAFVYSYRDRDSKSTLIYDDYSDAFGDIGLEPQWVDTTNQEFLDFDNLPNILNPSTLFKETLRTDSEREFGNNQEYNLNYRKEYSSREHNLNMSLQFRSKSETEDNIFGEDIVENFSTGSTQLDQTALSIESEDNLVFQADYVNPLGKDHKWEAGVRGSIRRILTDFKVEERIDGGAYQVIPGFQNIFDYDEDIAAGYFIYGNRKGNISYQAGLRGEYSIINTLLTSPEGRSENPRTYFNLFPSGHVSFHFNETDAIQLSYSRRIRRPRFWTLNPFYTYQDRRNFFSGNPNLDPELTDSYELGNLKYWNDFSLSTAIFYRRTIQPTQRVLSVDRQDFTTLRIPINIGASNDYGLDVTVNYPAAKWLRLSMSTDVFIRNQTLDQEKALDAVLLFYQTVRNFRGDIDDFNERFSFSANDISNLTWNSRLTARLTIAGSDIQIRGNYRGPTETTQGFAQGIASLNLGWSKDFLPNKNLTLTLSVRDVFNSRRRTDLLFLEDFYQQSSFQWRARSTTLTASYRINQKKKRGRGNGGFGGEGGGEF